VYCMLHTLDHHQVPISAPAKFTTKTTRSERCLQPQTKTTSNAQACNACSYDRQRWQCFKNIVMDHTTPSDLDCVPLGIQSVAYPSEFDFLSHCSPVSLKAQLGLLDCERCRWRGQGHCFACRDDQGGGFHVTRTRRMFTCLMTW
jgi:hypothetical protein